MPPQYSVKSTIWSIQTWSGVPQNRMPRVDQVLHAAVVHVDRSAVLVKLRARALAAKHARALSSTVRKPARIAERHVHESPDERKYPATNSPRRRASVSLSATATQAQIGDAVGRRGLLSISPDSRRDRNRTAAAWHSPSRASPSRSPSRRANAPERLVAGGGPDRRMRLLHRARQMFDLPVVEILALPIERLVVVWFIALRIKSCASQKRSITPTGFWFDAGNS